MHTVALLLLAPFHLCWDTKLVVIYTFLNVGHLGTTMKYFCFGFSFASNQNSRGFIHSGGYLGYSQKDDVQLKCVLSLFSLFTHSKRLLVFASTD